MYHSPLVLGIGAHRPLDEQRDLSLVLEDVGTNTGNMLFAEAAFRHLSGARRATYHFEEADLEGRDCIVLTAANWLMPYGDFGYLVEALEATSLPVFIIGVGAQAGIDRTIPTIAPATLRLMQLISDRSSSLAVRGEFSAEVLAHYGIRNVDVTGCPSLLMAGPDGAPLAYPDEISWRETVVHGTRHLLFPGESFQRFLYQQAMKHDATLVLQSELADMYLARGVSPEDDDTARELRDRLRLEYDAGIASISRYLLRRGRIYFSIDDWFRFLRGRHFCVGSRIHGTIAGLLSGVPSILIAHDSRTVELAETMRIPYVFESAIDMSNDLSLPDLMDYYSFGRFDKYYQIYRSNFLAYFTKNGLQWDPSRSIVP